MGIEREHRHRQREHRRARALAGLRGGKTPRAPRLGHGRQPQQQAEEAGFGEDLEHDLVRVQCWAGAPHFLGGRVRIARRVSVAETTCADTIDRVLFDHAGGCGPDLGAAGQGLIDAVVLAFPRHGGARDPVTDLGHAHGEHDRRHRADRNAGQQPAHAHQPPAGEHQHQGIGQPRRARTGQDQHDPHRGGHK
ncbi:hypothetical protein D3C71_1502140 [compost metagenome]